MPASAALEVRDLWVRYPAGWRRPPREAVRGLSFRVEPGEVVGFIGPNGAGKSSTIKALMGFLRPHAGEVCLLGAAAGSREARRQVGFLPEVALYYPWLTPVETLTIYGRLAGLSRLQAEQAADSLLPRVGLAGREREPLRRFSKGMLQRVGIAQALLGEPRLLVLDEVSSGLDPLGRRDLRRLLQEQKERGVTIFFSSHELSEVAQLCDRVLLVNRGTLLDERPVRELLRHLRRYWVRFGWSGADPPPLAGAQRVSPATSRASPPEYEAETASLAEWRAALVALAEPPATILDAGERQGTLEDYFVHSIEAA
jgi:ABC-2 type transport system ATP-binding protein